MFEQVHNQRFYMQIVNQIKQLIDEGKLKVGDRLPPERILSEQFGASRASIREALSALETLGLIESKSGQGNFIKVDASEATVSGEMMKELFRSHSPYEIFEARMEIEPSMAALVAERAGEEDIVVLERSLAELNSLGRKAVADHTLIEDFMEADRKFHLEIQRAARNNVLFAVAAGVNLMMKEKPWRVMKRKSIEKPGNIHKFEGEHTAILAAIKQHDPEQARALIRQHIEGIKKDIFQEG